MCWMIYGRQTHIILPDEIFREASSYWFRQAGQNWFISGRVRQLQSILRWFCAYINKYIRNVVGFITFSRYQNHLRAVAEFHPEYFLCFEAVAVFHHGISSPSVVVAPFVHGFLALDRTAPPAPVISACMLLNIEWSHVIIPQRSII